MQPLVQALRRVGAQDAIGLVLQDPLDTWQELIVKPHVGQEPEDLFLGINLPRLRQDHQIQLPYDLLVLNAQRAPDTDDALVRPYEQEAPVRRYDGHHVQHLGSQVRQGPRLDEERQLGRVEVPPPCLLFVVTPGMPVMPVYLDLRYGLPGLRETILDLRLDHRPIVREQAG